MVEDYIARRGRRVQGTSGGMFKQSKELRNGTGGGECTSLAATILGSKKKGGRMWDERRMTGGDVWEVDRRGRLTKSPAS